MLFGPKSVTAIVPHLSNGGLAAQFWIVSCFDPAAFGTGRVFSGKELYTPVEGCGAKRLGLEKRKKELLILYPYNGTPWVLRATWRYGEKSTTTCILHRQALVGQSTAVPWPGHKLYGRVHGLRAIVVRFVFTVLRRPSTLWEPPTIFLDKLLGISVVYFRSINSEKV